MKKSDQIILFLFILCTRAIPSFAMPIKKRKHPIFSTKYKYILNSLNLRNTDYLSLSVSARYNLLAT